MKLNIDALRAALAQPETAIHCDTVKKAVALFEAMEWTAMPGGAYAYANYGNQTCFTRCDDSFLYCGREYYSKNNFTILTLDDYILPNEPLICKALGVKVGQEFAFASEGHEDIIYHIDEDGSRWAQGYGRCENESTLIHMINNPHLIRILPRWTEDDIADADAVMRIFPDYKWVARDERELRDGTVLFIFETEPQRQEGYFSIGLCAEPCSYKPIPRTAFPSVTWENSPVKLEEVK